MYKIGILTRATDWVRTRHSAKEENSDEYPDELALDLPMEIPSRGCGFVFGWNRASQRPRQRLREQQCPQ
jgi:hypothetical protein